METKVREELHKIIDEASDIRVKEIYDWLNEGIPEGIKYTPGELNMFYTRLAEHEEGKSKQYAAEESFSLVRNNKA
jgi:hypothetical protein